MQATRSKSSPVPSFPLHILKTQIGTLPNGIDLTDSVENEFYCLSVAKALGLPVNAAHIATFGKVRALVIERFDRLCTDGGRLIRLRSASSSPSRPCRSSAGNKRPGRPEAAILAKLKNVVGTSAN